ncbi:MAG: hypothetical protein NW205_10510 [Hyphomicrobiaceae bacterium]|nr:hypothetical protein [Hyphomicrobiaceae bacterium]
MMDAVSLPAALVASGLLGAMLFFAGVIAPLVFKVLPAEDASRFLRAQFKLYYVVLGAVAAAGTGVALAAGDGFSAGILGICAILLFGCRFVAVPVINVARDGMLAGDSAAKARFDTWHRGTVVLNLAEMVGLAAIVGRAVLA